MGLLPALLPRAQTRRSASPTTAYRKASASRALTLREQPKHRAERVEVLVGHALLERDDRVVRDMDVLGTQLFAALRDVAVANAGLVLEQLGARARIHRVHLVGGDPHHRARPEVGRLALVVAEHVADVLAE